MFRHLTTLSFALRPSPTSMHVTIEKLQSRQWQSDPMLTGVDHLSLAKINLTMTPADESLSKSPVENHPRVEQAIRKNLKPRGASGTRSLSPSHSDFKFDSLLTYSESLPQWLGIRNCPELAWKTMLPGSLSAAWWLSWRAPGPGEAVSESWRRLHKSTYGGHLNNIVCNIEKLLAILQSILCTILLLILLNITYNIV